MNMVLTERDTLPRHVKSFFYLKNKAKALDIFVRFLRLETHTPILKPRILKVAELTLMMGMNARDHARVNANSMEWMTRMQYEGLERTLDWIERRHTEIEKDKVYQALTEYFEYLNETHDGLKKERSKILEMHCYIMQQIHHALHQIEFLEGIGFDVVHSNLPLHNFDIHKETIVTSDYDASDVYFVSLPPSHPDVKEVVRTLHRAEPTLVVVSNPWAIESWRRNCCPSEDDLLKMTNKVVPDEQGHRTLMFV